MAWDTGIGYTGENSIDCCRIRMTNAACLNTNAYLIETGILKGFSYFRELSRFFDLNCSVRCALSPPLRLQERTEQRRPPILEVVFPKSAI
jgi:hypothetical protein